VRLALATKRVGGTAQGQAVEATLIFFFERWLVEMLHCNVCAAGSKIKINTADDAVPMYIKKGRGEQ